MRLDLRCCAMRVSGLCLVFALLGCQQQPPDYKPSATLAEDAVRRGLDAWRSGLAAHEEIAGKPAVQIVDAGRKPGQMLDNYRILGETRGPTGRTFVVTLQLIHPDEDIKTQYIVVGIDPLWVFRQEDYELLAHWDHHMPAETTQQP